jgi:hypothetical protein
MQRSKGAQAFSIFFQTAGKALVGEVEQRQPAFFNGQLRQLLPTAPASDRYRSGCGSSRGTVPRRPPARFRLASRPSKSSAWFAAS